MLTNPSMALDSDCDGLGLRPCSAFSLQKAKAIDAFISQTNISPNRAAQFLEECDWDLEASLKKFELEGADHDNISPSTSNEICSDREVPSVEAVRQPPGFAFCLPDLDRFAPDFRNFLEKDLIETATQRRLENSKHLNWWSSFGQKLYPLSTTGDGNCLLHAASLGIWGVHDRQLTLREALYEMLIRGSRRTALWRRWKWSEHKAYMNIQLRLSDEEWKNEWQNNIVAIASPLPRKQEDSSSDSTDQIYESLEAIHVFALAHVLKRPIIVVSDTVLRNAKGEELSPIPFGGVYLPLECPPEQCHRSPLVLCYDSAHFSPLVPMRHESSLPQIAPITDANRNLLPLHFAVDPGADFDWGEGSSKTTLELSDEDRLALMNEYMDLVRLDLRRGSLRRTLPIKTNNSSAKSLTLASSGVSNGSREKKRIMEEIRQHLLRTLRLSRKDKENGIDVRLCAADLARSNCVVASRLVSSSHEYMDDMVREYMKTARERFQSSGTAQNNNLNGNRKRLSRSFSTSSIPITCINQCCSQPASQLCNFLCRDCFEHQKEMMMSFNCRHDHPLLDHPTAGKKSSTMPLLCSVSSEASRPLATTAPGPLLGIITKGQTTTASVSKVEGENGVTHYFVDDSANNVPNSLSTQPLGAVSSFAS